MGRVPCCEKDNVKRGQWTPEEDNKLSSYIAQHGTRNWRLIPKNAGLQRCGKSCRLRWTNYLRPDLKHGEFSDMEEQTIIKLHAVVGNRWSLIAAQLPGRTDNDVKNHWNTKLKKKLSGMGIDPVTHKPFSHLMAEIATTLAPPQVAHLAEAALGCFKDEMLHLLTKKRVDLSSSTAAGTSNAVALIDAPSYDEEYKEDATIQKIKLGLSRAMQGAMSSGSPDGGLGSSHELHHQQQLPQNGSKQPWSFLAQGGEPSDGFNMAGMDSGEGGYLVEAGDEFIYGGPPPYCSVDGEGSAWSQSMCTGSTCSAAAEEAGRQGEVKGEGEEEDGAGEAADRGSKGFVGRKEDRGVFEASDCNALWDLADDLMLQ